MRALYCREGPVIQSSDLRYYRESYVDNPELKFPRRMPTPDPGDLNRDNWMESNANQGFSNLDESPDVLNSQRMWWDELSPEFVEGE